MKKIAIIITTGRKTIHTIVEMLVSSLKENSLRNIYKIDLIISYDPTYLSMTEKDFHLHKKAENEFSSIVYLGPGDDGGLDENVKSSIPKEMYDILFSPRGYCTQKNRAIIAALKKQTDAIVFLDDDEYFVASCKKISGQLSWIKQDVIGIHAKYIFDADITNGLQTGYFSPIPSDFSIYVPKDVSTQLGVVLSCGSEFIHQNTFTHTRSAILYTSKKLPSKAIEIPLRNGIKFITAGNLAINAHSLLSGTIPPFFNPKFARGEDAFMGMRLQKCVVKKVPTYIFHDPFQKYLSISKGLYPSKLDNITISPTSMDRFIKTLQGWLKYAPLFILLNAKTDNEWEKTISYLHTEIGILGKILHEIFHDTRFLNLADVVQIYANQAKQDKIDIVHSYIAWKKIMAYLQINY